MTEEELVPEDEWEKRQLCSDGNCIGVIGPDGRCKECGKPAEEGPAPPDEDVREAAQQDAPSAKEEAEADPEAPAMDPAGDADAPTAAGGDDDWSRRRLCPDGNCIGVIGPDGRCTECGRPAE